MITGAGRTEGAFVEAPLRRPASEGVGGASRRLRFGSAVPEDLDETDRSPRRPSTSSPSSRAIGDSNLPTKQAERPRSDAGAWTSVSRERSAGDRALAALSGRAAGASIVVAPADWGTGTVRGLHRASPGLSAPEGRPRFSAPQTRR